MSRKIFGFVAIFILLGSFGCQQIEKKNCLRFFFDGVPATEDILKEKNKFYDNETNTTEAEKENGLLYHSPYKEDKCVACHDFSGNSANLLKSERLSEICFQCHKKELFQKKNVNLPVFLGKCDICHDPHQSKEKALMKEKAVGICLICHPDFSDRSKFIQGKGSEIGACVTCHNVHSSDENHLLRASEKEVCGQCHKYDPEKKNPTNMDLKSMYAMPKCVMCHKKDAHAKHLEKGEISVSQNEIAKDYARWRAHPPFEKAECKKCHIFSGDESNILVEGGVTKVCLECHKAESIKPDNPKKDFLAVMYKMPLCISCHKAVVHDKK